MAVSFIGGGNRGSLRKPLTCRKSLINFITLYTLQKIVTSYAHFQHSAYTLFCHNIHEMYTSISDKIEQECILKVYHVFILYHIVVINIFKNSIWRIESLITSCLLNWRHTLANERTCYIFFDFFLNVSQLSLTFLTLFQKLYNAARDGDVNVVQDCLQKGADVHYKNDLVSI